MAGRLIKQDHNLRIEAAPLLCGHRGQSFVNVGGNPKHQSFFQLCPPHMAARALFRLARVEPQFKALIADIFNTVPTVEGRAAAMAGQISRGKCFHG